MSESPVVSSPCVGVCRLDAGRVCAGCFRSLDEIAEWSRATPERQQAIVAAARARAAQAPPGTDAIQRREQT